MRHRLAKVWAQLNLAVLRWLAQDHPAIIEIREQRSAEYVEPLAAINRAVLLAAWDATCQDPQHQARLNACLEGLRGTKVVEASTVMVGSLVGAGYPPEEALARLLANAVALGIVVEKRLRDA